MQIQITKRRFYALGVQPLASLHGPLHALHQLARERAVPLSVTMGVAFSVENHDLKTAGPAKYKQEYRQSDMTVHHLGIRKRLACDCRERLVLAAHPFIKLLFHNLWI